MAYQGEYFRDRHGEPALRRTPPICEMLRSGVPVGAGTDATRVASYNPFVSLYWLITGKTVGGLSMYDQANRVDRMGALRLWTVGSSWFSTEDAPRDRSFRDNSQTLLSSQLIISRFQMQRSNSLNRS
jgi:predicted amidohydrolase YtcJ